MSTIQVANIHLTSTGSTRIEYTNNDTFKFVAANTDVLTVNSSSTSFSNINDLTIANSFTVAANGNVGIGTTSPENQLHIQTTTATTNTVTSVLRLDSQSSSTPANGIGVALEFVAETSAGNPEIGATIEAITTDVTATSEDFDLSFKTMAAGAAAAERMRVTSAGDFQFDSGYGSVATGYGCRAWVNFNGTGTVAIRADGNVSSITDNGTGDYTVNFTTAMPDADYTLCGTTIRNSSLGNLIQIATSTTATQSLVRIESLRTSDGTLQDNATVCVAIFR